MRQARLRAPKDHTEAYYHCVSRVVNREFIFGDAEKDFFVQMMRKSSTVSKVLKNSGGLPRRCARRGPVVKVSL